MLLLFKQIRASLAREGRFRKYLPYALGEIILVVIGILIALQINTLNEERKDKNLEKSYYRNLLVDLEKDSLDYVFRQRVAIRSMNMMSNIIDYIDAGYPDTYPSFIPVDWVDRQSGSIIFVGNAARGN